MNRRQKLYPCMLCEKRYAELEEAEVCERSHANPREKYDDDGIDYADPRDFLDELRGLD